MTTLSAEDHVDFSGDPSITATHKATFEVTKDPRVHGKGDCIIGVKASKGCADLNEDVKRLLREKDSTVTIAIQVEGHVFQTVAQGDPSLTLRHPSEIVVRKSRFTCSRTLAVSSTMAASDIPCEMIRLLRNASSKGVLLIKAEKREKV